MANQTTPYSDALDRAVGTGSSAGKNLGAYKDANGNTTTYRPEFAGQTVQMGSQYVTYNEKGYPTKAVSKNHAQSLGNDYTKKNMGLDQTKISNAGDIYQGIYNAVMNSGTTLSGNALDNAYGKRNIQYSGALGVADYDKLIRDAAAKGSNVLAGFLEDSRNALLQSQGRGNEQTSTYNGGWNYVDNGGGVGNIYAGALADKKQANQTLGGGWYAGQGKGDAAEEYFYRNTDAPTMQEVLSYAAALGYDVNDDSTALPLGNLAREMMANGYVSPENLRKAETLKITVPAALKNLGIESDSSGTEALDAAIRNMQTAGSGANAAAMKAAATKVGLSTPYSAAISGSSGLSNPYSQHLNSSGSNKGGILSGGSTSGNDYESELLKLYGEGGAYSQAQDQLKALIDADVAKVTSEYEGQKDEVNRSYADTMREYYINNEKAKKNLGQQMAAYGVTGGATESTLLGLNTNYQEAVRQAEQERISTLNELEQAIQQAKLTGDISYAEQALALAQQQAESYGNVLQLLMNRQDAAEQQAYDRQMAAEQLAYDRQMAAYNQQLAAQDTAFNRQMMQAELLASAGDFSGYKALGLTDAEIATLNSNYQKQNTPKVVYRDVPVADPMPVVDPVEELVGDLDTLVASNDVSRADLRDVINGAYNQGMITATEKTKLIDYYCR